MKTSRKKTPAPKRSTYRGLKTGVKVTKTLLTSRYVQSGVKIAFALTVAPHLRRLIMEKEGVL